MMEWNDWMESKATTISNRRHRRAKVGRLEVGATSFADYLEEKGEEVFSFSFYFFSDTGSEIIYQEWELERSKD